VHPAADIVSTLYPAADESPEDRRVRVFAYWERAAGATLARVTRPLELRGKTLWVGVEPGPWLDELGAVRERIRTKLNRALGAKAVATIRFRPAPPTESEMPNAADPAADGVIDPIRRRLYLDSKRGRSSAPAPDAEPK